VIGAARRFAADVSGATAVEYALMVSLVSIGIAATVFSMGDGIKVTLYDQIANALANMM
jgi:Flp pilus assembly pilin Flp